MIKYALRCGSGHGFEAWFRDSAAYDEQAVAGVVRCPECGTPEVSKAIMAPNISKGGGARTPETVGTPAGPGLPAGQSAPPASPESIPMGGKQMAFAGKMREALRELRQMVERNADYVGPKFAEEARKIHRGESKERAIYGESSDEDAEALKEEGIDVARIPWVDKHDA